MKYMKSTPANIQAAVDEMNAELGGQYVTADAHGQHLVMHTNRRDTIAVHINILGSWNTRGMSYRATADSYLYAGSLADFRKAAALVADLAKERGEDLLDAEDMRLYDVGWWGMEQELAEGMGRPGYVQEHLAEYRKALLPKKV